LLQGLQAVTFGARGAPLAGGVAPKQTRRALGVSRLRHGVQDQQQVPRVYHRTLAARRTAEPLLESLWNTPRIGNERRHRSRLARTVCASPVLPPCPRAPTTTISRTRKRRYSSRRSPGRSRDLAR